MMSCILSALCALQAPADAVEPQDPDRPTYPLADLKALREANVFSPKRASTSYVPRREERRTETRPEPAAPRPRPIQVTGFVLDPATKAPRAILEDRNEERLRTLKEPLFAKPGDEAAGWIVEAVTAELVTIVQGETRKMLRVGESFPEPAAAAGPAAGVPTADAPPPSPPPPSLGDAEKNDILERLRERNKRKRSDEP